MYSCMLDTSKAFDRLDFIKLFNILLDRKLPNVIIRSLMNLYTNQEMVAEWNGVRSQSFSASNGCKQGAILSCHLFCIYLDVLIMDLNRSGYGCRVGNCYMGALSYADDLSVNSPTVTGLQKMINIAKMFCCFVA